jgi:hypothetical protein
MTDTNPIYYQDATALAALIRTRQLSYLARNELVAAGFG